MWYLVTDSSCDQMEFPADTGEVCYERVPFTLQIEGQEFVDDEEIDVPAMMDAMSAAKTPCRSACPSPAAWLEHFAKDGKFLAFTISKELSGSYNSACAARTMALEETPGKEIAVINSLGTGPSLILQVRLAIRLIREGLDFDTVAERVARLAEEHCLSFALCSFDNLVKNGRMNRFAGFVAQKLGFWGIGVATPEGRIQVKKKARTTKKMLAALIDEMLERGGKISAVVISHCLNPEVAEQLKEMILERFKDVTVDIYPTRGLDSFYAERGGLIVGIL